MRLKNIILIGSALLLCSSCSYLDFDETNNLYTQEDIYKYFDRTKQMLTNVYSYMPQDFGVIAGAMRDCASDDAVFGATGGLVQSFTNGNWSALNTIDTQWNLYNGIRAANEFLESIEKTDFTRFEHNGDYQNWVKQLKFFPYEARILRAQYFFELARRYGDIAMPKTMLTQEEANTIGKTPFNEVIAFIVSECNDAIAQLPETYAGQPNNETGRITKGYAMALKSKALLYAASLLHSPSMDKEKWKESAKAALDLINTGLYELDPGVKVNDVTSPEVVLFRMNGDNSAFELNNFPIRFTEGQRTKPATGTFPSQNLVDAFQTINGYDVTLEKNGWICDDPKFDPQKPYENRDPRLARTVLANGMTFKDSEIQFYPGGIDYAAVSQGGSPTGYFLRKYIQETTSFVVNQEVNNKHAWIIYRYAETLLAYAESMIEAFDNPDYTDATYTKSARWAINQVRNNAEMPDITTTGKDEFIHALQNEWRVEFAFEDHRFWDIRRWKIGDKTQRELYGVNVNRSPDGILTFEQELYSSRAWNERMYLYPIPQSEIYINANLSPQNTGW